ncbi:MAG: chondroitinase-B domain-containing protein [Paludibacter sp.]
MKKAVFCFLIIFVPLTLNARQVTVSSTTQISGGSWSAGDTIVMKNGTWINQAITLKANGTATNPVVLKAQTPGSVILSGSSHIGLSGSYIEVSGLFFKNGTLNTGSEIVGFRTSSSEFANNCRLTNCAIVDCNPTDSTIDSKWVSLYGANNRVDHCTFQNKSNMGTLLVVWLTAGIVPNHIVDNNYFGYRNSNVDVTGAELNGQEIMRLGDSSTSMQTAGIQVTNNFFEHCNGEIETISNKSCGNYYSNNVFYECNGMLTLRHGNGCTVDGNYFFGNKNSSSGGVRIIGENHKVYNNYFEKLGGSGFRSAVCIVRGKLNSLANEYFQVKNALVAFNTMVDCSNAFTINYNSSSTYTMPPIGTVIAHNNVYNTSTSNTAITISQTDPAMDITWNNNLINQGKYTNLTATGTQVIVGKDPKLVLAGTNTNMYEPGSTSALLSYTTVDYPEIAVDIRGRDRGTTAKVPGCSQTSGSTTRVMPNRSTTGATFFNGVLTDIKAVSLDNGFKSFISNRKLITNTSVAGKLRVIDISGKTVLEEYLQEGISSNNLHSKAGVYILNFVAENAKNNHSEKIIID